MGKLKRHLGFFIKSSKIINDILIPKYYDPDIEKILNNLKKTHDLISIEDLVSDGLISLSTGDEIGKMAYGTGTIPFIRTSDISNWELKNDPKQGISEDIYNEYKEKQDVEEEDILIVRDGTYLIGTSCILAKNDTKMLYCGGIYKIRTLKKKSLDPYLLFGILNTSIVKEQIRSKQFTRDVIDTLGKRFNEIILPFPKNKELKKEISSRVKKLIKQKETLRQEQKQIGRTIQFLE